MNNMTVFLLNLSHDQLIRTKNNFVFAALNFSNNFATIDNEARVNTKIEYFITHVLKTKTVAQLITFHNDCEVERTQLLTIPAMSVKNSQLAGFLLTQNRSRSKAPPPRFMIALITFYFISYKKRF